MPPLVVAAVRVTADVCVLQGSSSDSPQPTVEKEVDTEGGKRLFRMSLEPIQAKKEQILFLNFLKYEQCRLFFKGTQFAFKWAVGGCIICNNSNNSNNNDNNNNNNITNHNDSNNNININNNSNNNNTNNNYNNTNNGNNNNNDNNNKCA